MSGFNPSDLASSVENGLQIAGFIQKNRDKINKTYGRSAITGPTTKERAIAWEEFYKDLLEEDGGHDISRDSEKRAEEEDGHSGDSRSGQHKSHVSIHESDQRESDANRDNKSWDASSTDGKGDEGWNRSTDSDGPASGDRYTVTERTDESEIGTRLFKSTIEHPRTMDDRKHEPISELDSRPTTVNQAASKDITHELDSILSEESAASPKRLKSIQKLKDLSRTSDMCCPPIKKGTEEKSLSMYSMEEPSSENGATRDVHQSGNNQPEMNADVENVETGAASANLNKDQDNTLGNQFIYQKLDQIMTTQNKIMEKLIIINEIKEEITNIKKGMHNFGLTLSTIEGYINSLMIIIPKNGIDSKASSDQINPDLKMVIGRDNTRGLSDFNNKTKEVKNDKFGEDLFMIRELDEEALLPPVNKSKNHAAKFVPTDDNISIRVIEELIKRKVKDESIRLRMLDLVKRTKDLMPVEAIYEEVKNTLSTLNN